MKFKTFLYELDSDPSYGAGTNSREGLLDLDSLSISGTSSVAEEWSHVHVRKQTLRTGEPRLTAQTNEDIGDISDDPGRYLCHPAPACMQVRPAVFVDERHKTDVFHQLLWYSQPCVRRKVHDLPEMVL
jgi:hypothetical protein